MSRMSTEEAAGGLSVLHSQIVLIRQLRTVWLFDFSFVHLSFERKQKWQVASCRLQLAKRSGWGRAQGVLSTDSSWKRWPNERKQQDMSSALAGQRESSLTGENFHQFYTIHLTWKAKGSQGMKVLQKGDNAVESIANQFAVIDMLTMRSGALSKASM